MKNKTEGCRELTDRSKGGSCPFQANVKTKMSNHRSVNSYRGTSDAWDLEDIVKLGKKVRACPYYGTRELKNKSQVKRGCFLYLVPKSVGVLLLQLVSVCLQYYDFIVEMSICKLSSV